jgi:DIM1 family U5 snRNP protein
MGSVVLPHLVTGWHVDQAIMSEEERLVVIRFGRDWDPDCMRQDEVLYREDPFSLFAPLLLIMESAGIADRVKNFAVVYVCDLDQVPDFKQMYGQYAPFLTISRLKPATPHLSFSDICADMFYIELYDPVTIMFFFRNKHMMCDFGTGNNNKLNWVLEDKQELIDIIETIYRGAKKGRGLVVSPKDYSTRYRY